MFNFTAVPPQEKLKAIRGDMHDLSFIVFKAVLHSFFGLAGDN